LDSRKGTRQTKGIHHQVKRKNERKRKLQEDEDEGDTREEEMELEDDEEVDDVEDYERLIEQLQMDVDKKDLELDKKNLELKQLTSISTIKETLIKNLLTLLELFPHNSPNPFNHPQPKLPNLHNH